MITCFILISIAVIIGVIAIAALVTGGVAFTIIFGDLIVCAVIIFIVVRWIFKKKKK